jgi:5-hydroxyisourate hydrolase/2-oxo-4-hydroxy-4-carboxy-5-ureidoimidazoline decarboxylase
MITEKDLFSCCGATRWGQKVADGLPYESLPQLINRAEQVWYNECQESDWLESFTHHPKIGDIKSLEAKFADTKHLAGNEQAGVNTATREVLEALAQGNTDYEKRFGFIFIVCATGKSAPEMLRLLQDRLGNTYEEELRVAMGEQHKITLIRLHKLLPNADWSFLRNSQLTTHVLDTSIGKPGQNITVRLRQNGKTLCQGVTNADGRIPDLLPPHRTLPSGTYTITFDTARYFHNLQIKGFYPCVDIHFSIFDDKHYHVPLLVNPFGYSTYRGS